MEELTEAQKKSIRLEITAFSKQLLGIPYEFGAEWENSLVKPAALDCSELIEGCFRFKGLKMPDGSQNQYEFTLPTSNPLPADLVFFGRGGNPAQIYHVGLVFDESQIIEARGLQPESSFETGKVILRPRTAWEKYKNFCGYRSQPKLL